VSLGERDDKVYLADPVGFYLGAGGKPMLGPNSQLLMSLLVRVLKGHPEVAVLRIDVRGKDLSKEETEARGRAIVDFLVKGGIEASRLKVAGLGPGKTRVDFVVETRSKPKRAPMPTQPAQPPQAPSPPEPTASVTLPASPTGVQPAPEPAASDPPEEAAPDESAGPGDSAAPDDSAGEGMRE